MAFSAFVNMMFGLFACSTHSMPLSSLLSAAKMLVTGVMSQTGFIADQNAPSPPGWECVLLTGRNSQAGKFTGFSATSPWRDAQDLVSGGLSCPVLELLERQCSECTWYSTLAENYLIWHLVSHFLGRTLILFFASIYLSIFPCLFHLLSDHGLSSSILLFLFFFGITCYKTQQVSDSVACDTRSNVVLTSGMFVAGAASCSCST